jgi:hypothetical protein
MNRGLALVGVAGLILVLICLSWSTRRNAGHGSPMYPRGEAPAPGASARTRIRPGAASAEVVRLLPISPERISQAARLACAFAAAYTSHRYDQAPEEYLQRLASLMTPQLRATVEHAANDPAELNQRRRAQEISVGRADAETIRALSPDSVAFLVIATTHVTTTYTARTETARYAVTLTTNGNASGDGWLVYDIEPASAGQTGDSTAPAP